MLSVQSVEQKLYDVGVTRNIIEMDEVNVLPEYIDEENGENILYACSGGYDTVDWLIVCTNKKILLLNRFFMTGLRDMEFPLSDITSVTASYEGGSGSLTITKFIEDFTIDYIKRPFLETMVDTIERAREALKCEKTKPLPVENTSLDYHATIIEQNKQIIGLLTDILNEIRTR